MNNSNKILFFTLTLVLATVSQLKVSCMDPGIPFCEQAVKTGYVPKFDFSTHETHSKKHPQIAFNLCYSTYTKPIKFKNLTWFYHIYKTKEQYFKNGNEIIGYRQKKIISDNYELAPNIFTKFLNVGIFALPWLYICFWK